MIDHNLAPWLIEVNMNPCLSTLSQKQKVLIDGLVDDVLKLTVDNFFGLGRRQDVVSDAVADKEGYQTKFELIYQCFF